MKMLRGERGSVEPLILPGYAAYKVTIDHATVSYHNVSQIVINWRAESLCDNLNRVWTAVGRCNGVGLLTAPQNKNMI
jgi:hypothetical protein